MSGLHAKFQRAQSLQRLGKLPQAKALYQDILAVQPRQFDTLVSLGLISGQIGDFAGAVRFFDRALVIEPRSAAVHCNRGLALQELARTREAMESYAAAIEHRPDYALVYFNRGVLLSNCGQAESALRDYDKAIEVDGTFVRAHYNRGVLLQALQQWRAALAGYDRTVALDPSHVDAWANRGIVLRELGELEAALASHDRAIELDPTGARAHCNRGVTRLARNELTMALDDYDRAIRLDPRCAEAHVNRGLALAKLRRWHDARSSYDRGILLAPDLSDAYCGRGLVFDALGKLPEALADYDRALSLRPHFPQATFNKSLTLLSLGNYADGWRCHESRWHSEATSSVKERRTFDAPLWLGEIPIENKTILLYAEQGLGDTLQFCRYASLVAERGARVVLEVQRPLIGLMAGLPNISRIVAKGDPLPAFDFQCPLMSLPLSLATTVDTIPARRRYLEAEGLRRSRILTTLGQKNRPRVGLAWSGSASHVNDRNRSIALADLAGALPDRFQYFCLQKDIQPQDRPFLSSAGGIEVLCEELNTFDDTAALCECMDLVISVDTSLAHLSAALGRKTWVLLSAVADWRWLRGRADSPWYPTITVFRQATLGAWNEVLEAMQASLMRELG